MNDRKVLKSAKSSIARREHIVEAVHHHYSSWLALKLVPAETEVVAFLSEPCPDSTSGTHECSHSGHTTCTSDFVRAIASLSLCRLDAGSVGAIYVTCLTYYRASS